MFKHSVYEISVFIFDQLATSTSPGKASLMCTFIKYSQECHRHQIMLTLARNRIRNFLQAASKPQMTQCFEQSNVSSIHYYMHGPHYYLFFSFFRDVDLDGARHCRGMISDMLLLQSELFSTLCGTTTAYVMQCNH